MNIIDRLVAYVDPRAGLRRQAARDLLGRAYEGASTKDGWLPRRRGASPDADFAADGKMLRDRARSLRANVPEIRRANKLWGAYVIGTGITTQFVHKQKRVVEKLNAAYAKFIKEADADGRLNLFGLQRNAETTMRTDGEVLIRIRPRRATDAMHVPVQLQMLEIDWLDTTRTQVEQGSGNTTVCGIEYNGIGLPVAYWLYEQHPGDPVNYSTVAIRSRRIPAESIIHYYDPDRPGQGRGISAYHAVIATTRDMHLLKDAHAARKNLEARMSVLATGEVSDLAIPSGTENASANARSTGELGTLGSGNIIEVPGATSLTFVDPKPTPGHETDMKMAQHAIAAGVDMPYESISGDLRETNFSSARIGRLDFKAVVEPHRWLITMPRLIDKIDDAFLSACVLGGIITAQDLVGVTTDHSVPKWEYVNPKDDIDAELREIAGGLASPSDKIRQRNYNPETVFAEAAADFQRFKDNGMLEILLALQASQILPQAPAPAPAPAPVRSEEPRMTRSDVERLIAAVPAPQPPAPAPVVNVHLPEARHETHIHNAAAAAPDVRIDAAAPVIHVNVPTPIVNVTNDVLTPSVRVENTIQPAAVDVTLSLPDRKTTTTITRDADDNMTGSTSVEKDA